MGTKAALHEGNEFFTDEDPSADGAAFASLEGDAGDDVEQEDGAALENPPEGDPLGPGFEFFRCSVEKLPFGMQVSASRHHWPRVTDVIAELPAGVVGVKPG